ncbi:hypothetical protein [Glycomyces buryatensis]|uniref:SH3 domain-containing protein n=1 Tax=Glycomyces buryatensis TaxID=2570927 RepID=A0A4S8Q683_9ACTN|nr:hypothetical protein [Glycomyces buryatensis]THV39688.1 hypothetical protein FAB82_17060 [Glycomyces buryatensis]
MKRILLGLMATGAAAVLSVGVASSASAAESTTGYDGSPWPSVEAAQTCDAVADENRSVWAEPGTAAGTVGSVIAGRTYTASCGLVEGETYSACGATTSQWAYVNYSGDRWGYVPSACVSWAS